MLWFNVLNILHIFSVFSDPLFSFSGEVTVRWHINLNFLNRAVSFGFALLRSLIGLQNSRHFLNQSDLIVTWSHAFSRAWRWLRDFALWLVRKTQATFLTNQINRDLVARVFPRLAQVTCTCIFFEFWLIPCAVFIYCDWPEWLLYLVLDLRRSDENHSHFNFLIKTFNPKSSKDWKNNNHFIS